MMLTEIQYLIIFPCVRFSLSWRKIALCLPAIDFKDAFWNRGSLVPLVYLPLGMILIWFTSDGKIETVDEAVPFYYLLSTQSQVLGTILALVFTTTIVAAQLASHYSQRVFRYVLGGWVYYYFAAYLLGIGCPLFMLTGHFWESTFYPWVVRFCLLWGGLCLTLLVPYFNVIRRRLSISFTIDALGTEAMEQYKNLPVTKKTELMPPEPVLVLLGIILVSASSHDYQSSREGVATIKKMGEFLLEKKTNRLLSN